MEVFEMILYGLLNVLRPENLIFLAAGTLLGLVLGVIPGLTATMAIGLIIPLTFHISATQSLIMLIAAYNAGTYGGSVTAILLGTPGSPAAAATLADGFALSKQGKAEKAIKAALFGSIIGKMFAGLLLIAIAQPLAQYALLFGPAEYAVLMIFALTIIASSAGDSLIKGLIGGCLGLLFGVVGMDTAFPITRLTFGQLHFVSGINLIVMLIGAMAFAEILKQTETVRNRIGEQNLPSPKCKEDKQFTKSDLKDSWRGWVKGCIVGGGLGALPGLGPALACWVGYDAAKRGSKKPEEFGKGSLEGIAGAETATNAAASGSMIPLLSLGVPGDTGTALLIGAFLVQGLTPGPLVFQEAPQVVYNLFMSLFISGFLLFAFALLLNKAFARVARVQSSLIFPYVCVFSAIGVYAFNRSLFDIWVMIAFSILGYVMMKLKFPIVTMLIGFILSPIFENNARRALQLSFGDFGVFFSSPLTITFWILTFVSMFFILRRRKKS